MDGGQITGRYHWFGKIDLAIDDISFVKAETNTLKLYLKNGKRHTVMGLGNAYEVARVLRGQIVTEVTEKANTLIERLRALRRRQKKEIIAVFSLVVLMFILVFVTVLLTDGKDLPEFTQFDWSVFAIMCVSELVVVILEFVIAVRCGKKTLPIEHLYYMTRKAVIEQTAPSGNVLRVYTEDEYCYRLVVFGHSDDDEVFFMVQAITSDFHFLWINTSDVYETIDALDLDPEFWRDITDLF